MRKRIFFICGSMNQTTQMHQVSKHLPDYEHSFSPYYCHGFDEILRRLGLIEFTIAGNKVVGRCRTYLQNHGLFIDYQERIRPTTWWLPARMYISRRTSETTGSYWFKRDYRPGIHNVSSRQTPPVPSTVDGGYGDDRSQRRIPGFLCRKRGIPRFLHPKRRAPEKIVVTGIPNSMTAAILHQRFSLQALRAGLHVTLRELFRREDREAFIRRAVEIAGGRQLIFKLHPIENVERATREIIAHAPGAMVFATGSAEEMIANCDVLITRFSSTAFVGVALGKETYSTSIWTNYGD